MNTQSTQSKESQEPDSVVEEKIIKVTGEIQIRKYNKGRLLGKGGFAKCYEFICSENNKIFAAKVVTKSSLVKSRAKQKLISEIKIHKSLHHPQIVAFEHYFEDTENVYILLEMCQNQTLNELLKRRKRLTELEVQCYIVQLIKALKYLHSHKVIHRDLKLGNLFLTDKMELKVGDFGLATKLDYDGERKRTVCGTPNYIAPEILDGKAGHSYQVDIWSLGVIIYTLIIGKPPFETRDVKATYKKIKDNEYSFPDQAIISEAAKNLINKILVLDPEKRPSLDQILNHDFFNLGVSIPKLLPPSTLETVPSLSYIRQFMPDAGKNGIVNKPINDNKSDKYRNDPNLKSPEIWVKKWVDYSSKYGLGYLLNNGFCGVFFNDSSKIILNPKTNQFFYIERRESDKQEIINTYNIDDYPGELQKKVTLLIHFKNYLEEGENNEKNQEENEIKEEPFPYIKKWIRTRHAMGFKLSNKSFQVCFQDKTEIMLSSETLTATYSNKKGEKIIFPLNVALEESNNEMVKRLKYAKDILIHMNNMKHQKNQNNN
jgi:polo-like kinase 1